MKNNKQTTWDNKFGLLEVEEPKCNWRWGDEGCGYNLPDSSSDCKYLGREFQCPMNDKVGNKVVIDGVGADVEIVTNSNGGKQSKSPMAMHLIDPTFLSRYAANKAEELEYVDEFDCTEVEENDEEKHGCYRAIQHIADYMKAGMEFDLESAMDYLEPDENKQIINIAKILQYGAGRYAANNWRLIPEEEHINHALIHIIAHLAGDTQDDHINHALCRLMMAMATTRSADFDYCKFVTVEPKRTNVA